MNEDATTDPRLPEGIPQPPEIGFATGNWATELAFEQALGYYSPEELRTRFDLTEEQYRVVTENDAFKKTMLSYKKEIDDEGIAFKLRARKAAELVLEELTTIAFDTLQDASDRIKAIEKICEYAGLGAKQQKDGDGGIRVVIQTNLGLSSPIEGRGEYTIAIPQGEQ